MRIWLLKDSEPLPIGNNSDRLFRMGLIANMLAQRGHEVVWWTSSFDHFKKQFVVTGDQIFHVKPNYVVKILHSCGYRKNISLQRILHNRSVAKKFLQLAAIEEKPDIILAALPTVELALAAIKYGQCNNVKVLIDIRDLWPDIMVVIFPKFFRTLARLVLDWQFRGVTHVCENATGIIGITQEFLQWGLNYAGRAQTLFDGVYPLAYSSVKLDNQLFEEALQFWKNHSLKINKSEFVLSFVGAVHKSYQLDLVIEAVNRVKGVKLVIAGLGPEFNRYKKLIKECKYKNIILSGWVNRAQIHALLKLSSIGIMPYIERIDTRQAISNKMAEYLSFGLPIFLNNRGVMKNLLEQNECGFYYRNTNELVEYIEKVIKDRDLLDRMAKAAYLLYQRSFVAEKVYLDLCLHLEVVAFT